MSYCLDTNIVIDFLRNKPLVVDSIRKMEGEDLFVTSITLCELYKGVYLSNNSGNELIVINNFLNSVILIEFNQESCRLFGEEYWAHDLTVVTRNKKDFENINVKLEVW